MALFENNVNMFLFFFKLLEVDLVLEAYFSDFWGFYHVYMQLSMYIK